MKKNFIFFQLFVIVISLSSNIKASDFGVSGLFDTPTARVMNDGDFRFKISHQNLTTLINATYQATPRIETTFRYDNKFHDRSYGVKFLLKNETKYIPQISLGIRDIVGTGLWDGEYLVASKQINNIDISLGLGWGRYSERSSFKNPLIYLDDKYKNRQGKVSRNYNGYGGEERSKTFFRGEKVGLFGGIKYDLKKYNLKLLAEYNSDKFSREKNFGFIDENSPLSFGVEWVNSSNTSFGISFQHKNEIAFSIASTFNTKLSPLPKKNAHFISSADIDNLNDVPENINLDSWYDRLMFDMERSGLLLLNAS